MAESRFVAVRWLGYLASYGVCRIAYAMLSVVGRLPTTRLRHPLVRLALPLFRVGQTLSPRDWFPLRYLAWSLGETSDLTGAIPYYNELLRQYPSFVEGRIELAEALSDAGRFPEALEHLERAHHESPRDMRVHRALARALIVLNHSPDAIPLLEEVVSHDDNDAVAWRLLGAACGGAHRWDDAVAGFARAHALDANPQIAVEYVCALFEADRYVESETVLVDALARHGRHATLRSLLAHVLTERDCDEEAERILHDVLREDPRHLEARYGLASMLAHRGRTAEAAAIAEALAADFPDHENAYAVLGWVALKADRPGDALTAFDAALAHAPGLLHFRAGRAAALHGLGRSSEAQALVRSIVERDPSFFARHREWAKVGLPVVG
jgi:protein O-GlcNAc transferase